MNFRMNIRTESSMKRKFIPQNSLVSLFIPFQIACALTLQLQSDDDSSRLINESYLLSSIQVDAASMILNAYEVMKR